MHAPQLARAAGALLLAAAACGDDDDSPGAPDAPVSQPDGPALPDAGPPPDGRVAPETPAGEQLAWLVRTVNSGEDLSEAEFAAHFSADYQAECDHACFDTNYFRPLGTSYAPLVITGWEDGATDLGIWGRVHATGTDHWLRLGLVLDATDHTIDAVAIPYAPDLDPANGPIEADELGLFVYDPYRGNSTANVTVELVDRETGLSFDPAVTGAVVRKYGYLRLTVPAGETEVGVKVTHLDEQVTYTYSPLLVPGADLLAVPAYPAAAFPAYVAGVDHALTAGKAHLWGVLQWGAPAAEWPIEAYDSGIGCATITASPALSNLFYTAPPSYLPNTTSTRTALENSTFYSFNLEPVAHTITAQATGAPLAMTVPPLAADSITVVYLTFDRATYPTNPTESGCAP